MEENCQQTGRKTSKKKEKLESNLLLVSMSYHEIASVFPRKLLFLVKSARRVNEKKSFRSLKCKRRSRRRYFYFQQRKFACSARGCWGEAKKFFGEKMQTKTHVKLIVITCVEMSDSDGHARTKIPICDLRKKNPILPKNK